MRSSRLWMAGLVALVVAPIAACSQVGDTCDVENSCTDGGAQADTTTNDGPPHSESGSDGRTDAGADGANPVDAADGSDASIDVQDGYDGNPCADPINRQKPPSIEPCTIDNAYGVFVDGTNGSDTSPADGTMLKPFKTIGKGLGIAHAAGKRTYVCAGSYPEQLVVDTTLDGAQVYGGFACITWTYDAAKKPVVGLSAATGSAACPSCALLANSLATGATFEDVELDSPNASVSTPGASSFAVIVNASTGVVFHRCVMKAGDATAGGPGAAGSNYSGAQANAGLSPNVLTPSTGASSPSCTCTNAADVSTSGGGGNGALSPSHGTTGGDGSPAISPANPPAATGKGGAGDINDGNGCSNGRQGSNPNASGAGGAGALGNGSLSSSGWSNATSTGTSGTRGLVAQGGGGGGGGIYTTVPSGGGGSGGCGGCGGGLGSGGTGGGSSIALISFNSAVTLDVACVLTAGAGGAGGKGGDGQSGQSGGGSGVASSGGCNGGKGGNGTTGGGGGGGAAGHSIAIAYTGTAVADNGATGTAKAAAAGGQPGAGGSPVATKGADGLSVRVQQF